MNIVVDSNIVFSGMLNSDGNLAKVLLLSFNKLTFYSSQSLKEEIYSHAEKLKKIAGYSEFEFFRIFNILTKNINFINPLLIPKDFLFNAYNLTKEVDEDDTEFIALTDYLGASLWTGDKKLIKGMSKQGWTKFVDTNQLLHHAIL
ncbi:putative nucleotide-binding protein [Belliella baltica DSM 15883]|uniref:Putative nucleotide-binding protein n=1 Tax=Belliella baltica (strain DSM 15883 / CIP 108006 / LMG 21964 / BA134) TaxID=866536 RepID=I3Z6R9_BELBD|nr:PIN domain-containing protein [Belliella baltica]AFL84937.1 putative nucleotide-binding protein [Belliella baltica DSM 15883]